MDTDTNAGAFGDRERVARVMRAACKGKTSAARHIAGAVNDCYERLAARLLEQSDEARVRLGVSAEEQERQVVIMLHLSALEVLLGAARRGKA